MKQNDWIVATINNPTFDAGDFQHISNMTLDNTQLLSKDQYLKSRYIRENDLFKDSQGQFSEEKFDQFYKNAATNFKEFSTENIVDNYEYDMFDTMRPLQGKVKDDNFTLGYQQNPDHITIGISGFNEISPSDKSKRELAQQSKIRDVATGKDLDVSVDDISLWNSPTEYFKSLFDEPLVYATYDEDEEELDPYTGEIIKHKKGDWKVNDSGEYYTERLNGRSLIGKQVVSALDYLTPEESSIQKYDFFDSDGLDKSIGGIIAKDLISVIPLMIPYVNTAYSGLFVARELAKSLPMLYGMVQGLSGSDNIDSKFLNTVAAYGDKFTGSTSDYAASNTFAFENFSKLMSEVALQWGQQKFIANAFSKLSGGGEKAVNTAYAKAQKEYLERAKSSIQDVMDNKLSEQEMVAFIGTSNPFTLGEDMIKTGKWAETAFGKGALNKYLPAAQKIVENRMKMGQDLSLVYMAIVSNTDVYQSVLEKGGTPFEAAAITLGSTIGMFSVDKFLGLGEMFFNDEPARKALRTAAVKSANQLMLSAGVKQATETSTKKGIVGLIQRGIEAGKQAVSNYESAIKDRTLGFVGKSLGEGLEEVSEELVTDISKTMGELAGKLGYFSQDDYGAWENAFDRYTMSFLGGAAGGGLFYGIDAIQNRNKSTQDFQNDIVYLIRQGKKKELLDEIAKLRNQGKLGSKQLSYDITTGSDNKPVPLTANNEAQSQSDYIYNTLVKTINQLDLILNENQLHLSDNELFDKMVQGEYRANALSDFLRGDKEKVKDISYITRYQEDFQKLANQIANKESEIQNFINKTEDGKRKNPDFQEKLAQLQEEKKKLIEERDYLFGEGSLGYVEKMLFAIDPTLAGKFMSLNYRQFVRHNYGKAVEDLTESEAKSATKQYEQYSKNSKKAALDEAFRLFKEIQAKLNPEIQALQERDISKEIEEFKAIAELDPYSRELTYDSRLEGESDEEYNDRYTRRDSETEEQFKARQEKRVEALKQYNKDNITKWIEELASRPIDKGTFRTVSAKLGVLRKTRFDALVEGFSIKDNVELSQEIQNAIKTIGLDLKSRKKLYKQIRDLIRKQVAIEFSHKFGDRLNLNQWDDVRFWLEGISNETPEKKESIGFDKDYVFGGGTLTKGDLADYFKAVMNSQALLGNNMTLDDLIEYLQANLGWEFPTINAEGKYVGSDQAILNQQTIDYFKNILPILNNDEEALKAYPQIQIDLLLEEGSNPVELSDDLYEELINQNTDQILKRVKSGIKELDEAVNNDNELKALTKLENSSFINNPLLPLIDKISKLVRGNPINIEQFLEDLYEQYHSGESARNFELTEEQLVTIKQIKEDLELASAFIHAASVQSSYVTPIGHNKSINEFVANHSDIFGKVDKLPEIQEDVANFLLNELLNYNKELDAWIKLSQSNTANKEKKFIDADIAFNKARLKFYEINRNAFKISPTLDLLDGYDKIEKTDSLSTLVQIEELLHRRYKEAIKNNHTLEEILDVLMPRIIKLDDILSQKTAKLDENIEYKDLTYYDRFALVISNFALSSEAFYTKLKTFIENNDNVAPLSIQEYAAKLSQAQQANPDIINKALAWVAKKTETKIPILDNAVIITGVGGSGKSFAVSRLSVDEANTWLSGPTPSQVTTLQKLLPKGTSVQKLELFTTIFGGEKEAKEFLDDVFFDTKSNTWKSKTDKYFTSIDGLQGNSTVRLKKSVKVAKINKAPKTLIIDEATHYSTAELLLISKFCKENNISLILMGDNVQNGKTYKKLMYNMSTHGMLAWRTPKLFISLRDNNIQKIRNLATPINIVNTLDDTPEGEDALAETTKKLLDGDYKNLTFRYYNGTSFTGELITDNISPELVSKLSGEVGFIGTESSPFYKQLKDAGKNPILIDPLSVQGREFDYVVIDKEWKVPKIGTDLADAGRDIKAFIKDLYTMISRSRKGTIIIDNDNISSVISNVEDIFTGTPSSFDKAIKNFRKDRTVKINEALLKITEVINNIIKNEEIKNEEPVLGSKKDKPVPKEIKGTSMTVSDLEKDDEPGQDNSDDRKGELKRAKDEERNSFQNMTTPIRVYGNVSYSGIDIFEKDEWTNPEDSRRDLGIFLRKGEVISKGTDKYQLVRRLLDLKSLILYGVDQFDSDSRTIDKTIKDLFTRESLDNIEYYISVEDESNNNRLVGETKKTGLSNEERSIINGKVITVVAKIPVIKDGVTTTYEITLGGLANPKTWAENEQSIKTNINNRIDKMKKDGKDTSELEKYVSELSNNITIYGNKINELSAKNQQYRINKPNFSGMTTLIDAGETLRLESINVVDTDEGTRLSKYQPFRENCPYAVISKVYAITAKKSEMAEKFPGLSPDLAGKAVIYVSSNTLLNPTQLESLYMEQKKNPDVVPQVRMIVLDNLGVSFQSLYRKGYTEMYSIKMGDSIYTNPFESEPMGVRMYISMWNFRSNLKRFNQIYREWLKREKLDEKEVEELCKLDNDTYNSIKGDSEYLDEKQYREKVPEDVKNKLKLIWDFNDSLAGSVREFRLGYNQKNGAYLRKLTNLKEGGFYERPNNVVGIYINPKMAQQFEGMMDALFTNIIDKVVPPAKDPTYYISTKLSDLKDDDSITSWFDKVKDTRELHISMMDFEGKSLGYTLDFSKENALSAIPSLVIETAKFLEQRRWNPETLDELLENPKENRWRIKFGDEELDWRSLADPKILIGGQFKSKDSENIISTIEQPGIVEVLDEENNLTRIKDQRIDNMFNLMFHGVISTKYLNDFTKNDIRATDAYFKFGFKADPVLVPKTDGEENSNAAVVTNRRLFASDVVPGFPMFGISLDQYIEEETKPTEVRETEQGEITTELKQTIGNTISTLAQSGINIAQNDINKVKNIQDLYNLVNRKIKRNFEQYFIQRSQTPINNLIMGVSIEGNTLQFTYFPSHPEFKGETIGSQIKWNEDVLEITTEQGTIFNIYKDGKDLVFKTVTLPQKTGKSVQQITSEIMEALDPIFQLTTDKEKEQLIITINNGFKGNQDVAPETINIVINKVQEILQVWAKDPGDEEFSNAAKIAYNAVGKLTELKNTECPI